jgi:iron complex transport system permease protein
MQVLLRNPLADPYVLGVSGGAATGALLALLFGLGSLWLHGAAFSGALFSMLLVFGLSHGRGSWTTSRLLLTGVVVAAGWGAARSLNILTHGELAAASLGVRIKFLRRLIYLLASLLTATAVTLAGTIGFVGLIVPHMLRLAGVRDHRVLLPAAVLLGGCLLIVADTLARTLLAPRQLPVGVLTALVGVPLFLALLHHSRTLHGDEN